MLAAGGKGAIVELWDVTTGRRTTTFRFEYLSKASVASLAFSPDGRALAAGYSDQKVRLRAVPTGTEAPAPKK